MRELRIHSRRGRTYWTRVGFGLSYVLVGVYGFAMFHSSVNTGMLGIILFGMLVGLTFFNCLTTGIGNTSDCISEEKREGTLGLLFLTDLTGWDVIFGKLFAKGLISFYTILAGFPVLAFSLLLGGVTWMQFVAVVLISLNAWFFSHSAGIMISTFSVDARKAGSTTALLVLLMSLLLPGIVQSLTAAGVTGWDWISLLSPAQPLFTVMSSVSTGSLRMDRIWLPLLTTHALSWAFLSIASWRVPYVWQNRPKEPIYKRVAAGLRNFIQLRPARSRRLVGEHPFFWLLTRQQFLAGIVVLGAFISIMLWARIYYHRTIGGSWIGFYVATAVFLNFIFRFLVAVEASRHFEEQRLNGSLEFLLSCTPLSAREILEDQWLALLKWFRWPALMVFVTDMTVFLAAAVRYGFSNNAELFALILAAMLLIPVDFVTTGWVAMWCGMKSRKLRYAGGQTIALTLGLPWVTFGTCMVVNANTLRIGGSFWQIFVFWLVTTLSIQIWLAMKARRALLDEFRLYANPLYDGSFKVWRCLGRRFGRLLKWLAIRSSGNRPIPSIKD